MIVLMKTDTIYITLLHPTYVKEKLMTNLFRFKDLFQYISIGHRDQMGNVAGIY